MKKLIASITSMVLMLSPVAVGAGDGGIDLEDLFEDGLADEALVEEVEKEAKGDIEFTAHSMLHEAQFDAEVKDGAMVGNFKVETDADMSVEAELEAIKIKFATSSGGTAFFAGPVVEADMAEAAGKWISVAVVDSGSEDGAGDFIWLTLTDAATAAANVENMVKPGPAHAVTGGDIEIKNKIELELEEFDLEDIDLQDLDLDKDSSGSGSGAIILVTDETKDTDEEDNSGPGNTEDAMKEPDDETEDADEDDNSGPGSGDEITAVQADNSGPGNAEDAMQEPDDEAEEADEEDNSGPGNGAEIKAVQADNSGPGNAEDAMQEPDDDNSGPGSGGDADKD